MDLDPTFNNTGTEAATYQASGYMFVGPVRAGDHTRFCKCYIIILHIAYLSSSLQ